MQRPGRSVVALALALGAACRGKASPAGGGGEAGIPLDAGGSAAAGGLSDDGGDAEAGRLSDDAGGAEAGVALDAGDTAPAAGPVRLGMGRGGFCGIWADGSARCWGMTAPIPTRGEWRARPTARSEGFMVGGVRATAVGLDHRCVLLEDGTVRDAVYRPVDNPCFVTYVRPLRGVEQLVAGAVVLCARFATGEVSCWRDGYGDEVFPAEPAPVPGLRDVVEVAAGDHHVCARRSDGTVWCWGDNDVGQLGAGKYGTYQPEKGGWKGEARPLRVVGLGGATHIALGFGHSCAIVSSGEVFCWGYNHEDQLGTGVKLDTSKFAPISLPGEGIALPETEEWVFATSRDYPLKVAGLSVAVELALGADLSCARTSDGKVHCWGHLGPGPNRAIPAPVPGLDGVVQIVSAPNVSLVCALRGSGEALCWGANEFGVLGEEKRAFTRTPQPVRW